MTDISIKFDVPSSFKVYQAPEEVPTLFSGDKVVVYSIIKKRKSASDQSLQAGVNGTATLTGQILSKPVEFKITFEIPPPSDFQSSFGMPIVHYLASKSLICELQSGESWIDAATIKKQNNINLNIESGVVSSHTAYIALDEGQDKLIEGAIKTWDVVATMTKYPESMSPSRQGMHRLQRSSCSRSTPSFKLDRRLITYSMCQARYGREACKQTEGLDVQIEASCMVRHHRERKRKLKLLHKSQLQEQKKQTRIAHFPSKKLKASGVLICYNC